MLQRPDCSAVAGYRSWEKNFDRNVKQGSKGIAILAPCPYKAKVQETLKDEYGNVLKDADGNEMTKEVEKMMQGFKVQYVYAYEDTEGEPLPSVVEILNQDVKDYETIKEVLQNISPVPICLEEINSNANGYYSLVDRSIHVDFRLPELQSIKTTIHEIAHVYLHDKIIGEDIEATRNEREVCAESVAFTVCSYLGLDTSEYSFGYVSGWSQGKELKELQQKMELIRKTANTIITDIENEFLKIKMDESEALAFKNGTGYFLVEKVDLGYRYEMYAPDFVSLSKGVIEDTSISMHDAVEKSMEAIGSNENVWQPYNGDVLKQKAQEQTHALENIETEKQNIKKIITQRR